MFRVVMKLRCNVCAEPFGKMRVGDPANADEEAYCLREKANQGVWQ